VVTRRLQVERRTGSVRRPKTGVLPTVLRNQTVFTELFELYRFYSLINNFKLCYQDFSWIDFMI